jgi:hypothetical protein
VVVRKGGTGERKEEFFFLIDRRERTRGKNEGKKEQKRTGKKR